MSALPGGVIVAGGQGRRLALGRPKAFAVVGGRTLLARAEAVMAAVCGEVVIAAPADLALPAAQFTRVADAPGGAGPLAGVVAGLRVLREGPALVLGVDFPLLRVETLRALIVHLGRAPAVIPAPGGRLQPLAAVYGVAARIALDAAFVGGERSIVAAATALDPLVLGDAALAGIAGGVESFFNLNTPADLALAEDRLAARAAAGPGA